MVGETRTLKIFLWVHYFDPHHPYDLHPEFANLPEEKNAKVFPVSASVDADRAAKIRAYDSEIAFDDNDLAKTLKLLDDLGVRDNTLIIFVADHGESLGDDGGIWGHGDHIFQPTVHVPMIFSYPKKFRREKGLLQTSRRWIFCPRYSVT